MVLKKNLGKAFLAFLWVKTPICLPLADGQAKVWDVQDLRCDRGPGAPRGAMVPLQTSPQADLQSGLVLSHVAVSFAPRFCTVGSSPGVRVGSLPSDPSDVEAGFLSALCK